MKIVLTSVMVDDQSKALAFYTDVLGFVKKKDIPMGDVSFLTVVSPEGAPASNCSSSRWATPRRSRSRRPCSTRAYPRPPSDPPTCRPNIDKLRQRGVVFRKPPTRMGPVTIAVFEDTCGNLIQIHQA